MARPANSKSINAPMPLLNMLAEVASATLKSDPSLTVNTRAKNKQQCSSLPKLSPLKKSCSSDKLTLDQIRVLSDKMLVDMFSEFTSDEMKRNYSYRCYLIPDKCSEAFTSFGNEAKSRLQMKSHLLTHISQLLAEANAPGKSQRVRFTAEPLHARQKRLQGDGIKKRKQIKRCVGRKRKKTVGLDQEHSKKRCNDIRHRSPKHVKTLNIIKLMKNDDAATVANKFLRNKTSLTSDKSSNKSVIDNDNVYKKENINTETIKKNKKAFCTKCHKEKKPVKSDVLKDKLANSQNGLKTPDDSNVDDSSSESQPSVSTGNMIALSDKVEKHVFFDSFSNCVMQEVSTGNDESSDEQQNAVKSKDLLKPSKKNVSALKKLIELEREVQPYHDHCYTSTLGKMYVEDSENVENSDLAPQICSQSVSPEFIIPTHPFPSVYTPILPHISEIKEYGKMSKESPGNSKEFLSDNSVKKSVVQKLKSKEKQTRVRRIHKVIIPEEMEPDSEDDENVFSDLSSFCIDNIDVKEENNSSDIPDEKCLISRLLMKNASELTPSQEKKIALKLIRQLRTKKRENRAPLICQICRTKSFTAQATLMYHYRSHAGIKPFSCTVCEATFTRQHSLNYHMLIHNDKSRFVCSDCGRKFRHPSHYKEHLRRHTGETPYECSDCPLRFKTRNTYKRHLKTRHGKILTAQGIRTLSAEEFCKVRTSPRKKSRHSPVLKQDQETQWPEVAFTQNATSIPMVDKSC